MNTDLLGRLGIAAANFEALASSNEAFAEEQYGPAARLLREAIAEIQRLRAEVAQS